ncbi:MerR family transcriptional regulator [Kitasatospora atroaurantiaca]|uniref:MerR-like DNA binding protein n=1 Tax=Kitasatospora atroaurantiaca TaxID=285545 RepID=A0A561ENV6_9ACTN|nr:MerR family transcriptional regulator [Kitasatospora atroaurantiaca]TWE17239.1 MerR-like DNA binding protein [Kitasatospora atroaurantiaca]
MRIGELSSRTAVPVPTIKYYLREGLLPGGERTSPNQAQYGEAHVRRLKLVRAMLDVGKLSIAATREVLTAIDSPGNTLHGMLGVAQSAVTTKVPAGTDEAWKSADELVAELVERRGWQVKPSNPAWQTLTQIVVTFRDLGQDDLLDIFEEYAVAAERLSAAELAVIGRRSEPDSKVEGAVLGTVLGDALMSAMRRLTQEDASHRSFNAPAADAEQPAAGKARSVPAKPVRTRRTTRVAAAG